MEYQSEWISMPETPEELETIAKDYAETCLPGCCGSMGVFHTGWDKYPSKLTPLFKGKKGVLGLPSHRVRTSQGSIH
jgi:hypothetical protein